MKYSIWCYLFGHKWVGIDQWLQDGPRGPKTIKRTELVWLDNCIRCGLSKKEAGIG